MTAFCNPDESLAAVFLNPFEHTRIIHLQIGDVWGRFVNGNFLCVDETYRYKCSEWEFRAAVDRYIGFCNTPNSVNCTMITSTFSCTIFSDIVCCLLSECCVVTSFYQGLQTMSILISFSIYYTLSFCRLASIKLSSKILL